MIKIVKVLFMAAVVATNMMGSKINGAGASFPAPLYYDWAYQYQKETKNRVNYQSIGSGGGIKQISKRVVDFGASDKPLKTPKLAKQRLFQFPAVIGSIVVTYNLPGVKDEQLKLKNSIVADIFAGRITQWDDAAIKADNAGLALPSEKIIVCHRSDGSGTTYNFTYYLSKANEYWKNNFGAGKAIDWAVGIGGKGNEGVASLVKQMPFSIGYIENAYKKKNKLTGATLQTASGKWVSGRKENFKAAAKYASWTKKDNFYGLLTLQPGDTSYPIVAASFILLATETFETNKQVIDFFEFAFEKGDEAAKKLGYIPLPKETKDLIRSYWTDKVIK